ncbi:hypothetical protein MKX01_036577 [Papaver californicum]|nr:hypothetical protein MKX01_036577 [Papaver californicum]
MDMKLLSHVISSKHFCFLILLSFIVLNCSEEFSTDAYILPEDEGQLNTYIPLSNHPILPIFLFKNVIQYSCRSGELNLNLDKFESSEGNSKVVYDCSYNSSTVCHITYM